MTEPDKLQSILIQELPVRLANRIAHLDTLPDLDKSEMLVEARTKFVNSFTDVRKASKKDATPDEFANVLKAMLSRHANQAQTINFGMRHWREVQDISGEKDDIKNQIFIDAFLNRLFLSWIGIETLSSQYLALSTNKAGVVNLTCDPIEVCEAVSETVVEVARSQLKCPPRVEISYHGPPSARTLPLIPSFLYYVVTELLKNGVRAVGELHESTHSGGEPHPILLRISADTNQVALQISDQGGGIAFERIPRIWSYLYSTAKGSVVCEHTGSILKATDTPTALAGYGVGLPLSRLYAEYIGGKIHIMSMPNFGTHAFLFFDRSSYYQEALPTYMNWRREKKLREKLAKLEQAKQEALHMEEYFEAGRLKGLMTRVQEELDTVRAEGLIYN